MKKLLIGVAVITLISYILTAVTLGFGTESLRNASEIILYLLILLACLPYLFRHWAAQDKHFTFGKTNHIKFVDRGGVPDQNGVSNDGVFDCMIPEVPGHILENNKFRLANPGEKQRLGLLNTILHKSLGMYGYGIYPFKHIRKFYISKEKENLQGTGPADWINKPEIVVVDALRFTFPRPYVFTDVEIMDRFTVHLKVVVKFEVVDPYIPVYQFNGDFFTQAGSILQSQVIDELKNFATIGDFIEIDKGEVNGILAQYKETAPDDTPSPLNAELIRQVGLKIVGISINDYQPGDEATIQAIRQTALKTEEGKAKIVEAELGMQAAKIGADSYAQTVTIQTAADAQRIKDLAGARREYVRETVSALALAGSDPTIVSRAAADILEMEAATGKDSKITTLVKGQAGITIPTLAPSGGDKK